MAANGSVEEQGAAGELDDISDKIVLNSAKVTLNGSVFSTLDAKASLDNQRHGDDLASRFAAAATSASWITNNNKNKVIASSAAPLTFCSQDDPRRTLRIDRSGSTESVETTSGGDSSSSSSEPGSPSRPVTPHLTMAPVPAFECLRADSEDSGLGPSPAKSLTGGPTSPEGSISPIRFDDRSDSLLDLSPRTDNSDDLLSSEDIHSDEFISKTTTAIPRLSPAQGGGGFQFLLASSKNCQLVVNSSSSSNNNNSDGMTTTRGDFSIHFPSPDTPVTDCDEEEEDEETNFDEPPSVTTTTTTTELLLQPHSPLKTTFDSADTSSSSNVVVVDSTCDNSSAAESIRRPSRDYVVEDSSLLNPKVVLIRSDFGGQYTEESCNSQQSSSVGTTTGEDCCPHAEDGACKWLNCERSADANTTVTDLIDHIRQCHVDSQPKNAEGYACLWLGCKVYAKPSCSRSWLERHVLLHGGSKPFRCIVAGCRQRFGTEAALQRHVNSHFPQAGRHAHNSHQNKLSRNRRRHYKHRRKPQSHKSKDYFDDAIMEHVRHHLLQLSSIEGVVTSGPPSAITFHSKITGKRKNEAGKVHYLLHWSPENIVPDTWVTEDEIDCHSEKTIPVSQLPSEALQPPLRDALGLSGVFSKPGKRKRK